MALVVIFLRFLVYFHFPKCCHYKRYDTIHYWFFCITSVKNRFNTRNFTVAIP
jgi:hypothetical protein